MARHQSEAVYCGAIERDLRDDTCKTAILCASDNYDIDLINHFRNINVNIPGQVGITGFDNIDILQFNTPALTTIDYSTHDFGFNVVDTLVSVISGRDVPAKTVLQHSIVEGESL